MAPGVGDGKKETTRGRTTLQFVILPCLLCFSSFLVPVSGFALKNCTISYDIALCGGRELKAVPKDIPSTVKGYDLGSNKITIINVIDFKDFTVLRQLDLSNNLIGQIDTGAFVDLISLKKLNLNHNNISELGENLFKGLSNLTELRITRNHINTVAPMSFEPMISLEFLDISHNNLDSLTKVHPIVQHLPNLRELYIQKNNLSTFKSWELTNKSIPLKYLDLSHNPMTVFQITADVLPNLTWFSIGSASREQEMKLDVRNKTFLSRVSTLDISILQMSLTDMKILLESVNSSLTRLRMNKIKGNFPALVNISCTIPTMSMLQLREYKLSLLRSDLLKLCINATELDLAKNQIEKISDDAFRSSQNLKILTLSNNKLTSVPAAIRNLPILRELDLSFNNISSLGCDDFANQTMLRQLDLYQNSIPALQKCLFKDLIRLEVLKLEDNHITKLHGAFKKYPLPNLKQLRLNSNKLSYINDGEFKALPSLQNLSLHHNLISELNGTCFTGLTNLTILLLQSNQITEKHLNTGCFNALINLRRLELRENKIKYENISAMPYPPFSQLSHLEILTIPSQHRRLKSVLPSNFLKGLSSLRNFDVGNAQLTSLHDDTFIYTPKLQRLDISSNEVRYLSPKLFSPISNLTSLYISTTILRSLDFLINANLTKLQFLQARKNQYSIISKETLDALPALKYLDLMGNSFRCDCENAWFVNWIETNSQTQVYDAYNFICNYPEDLQGTKLFDLDVHSCLVEIEFIFFITTSCAILLFMVVSFTYHFLRWHLAYAYYLFLALLFDKRHKNKQAPNQYDAFISYNTDDEPWVIQEMLPKLEGDQGWRLCLHHRDFEPGKPIIDNITDSIYGSRKTICVISRKYLESEWCSKEIQVASFRLFDEQKDVLILVFLEDIPTRELSPYYRMRRLLKKRTYLSWPRAEERTELFWEKLRQALETGEDDGDNSLQLVPGDRIC